MGTQSRVGRPRKHTQRVELRLNADDPAVKTLVCEAAQRHVSLQEHIADILTARYLSQETPRPEPPATVDAAAALANEWM